jgi:hypothetical protein
MRREMRMHNMFLSANFIARGHWRSLAVDEMHTHSIHIGMGEEEHSVQNLLSSHLLSKNLNIRIYKTKILLVVLYGCEALSLT